MVFGPSIGDVIRERGPRANNYDLIRLVAATLVLVSHAFPLTAGNDAGDPLSLLTRGQATLGALAVGVFFFVSGVLVTQSYGQSEGLRHFLWKRALRLFPGLIVLVLLTTFVLGPLLTQLSPADYLSAPGTWDYLQNMLLRTRDFLPGVFEAAPFARGVNGSLWTLPYEVRCYLVVAALGVVGLLSWRWAMALLLACLAVSFAFVHFPEQLRGWPGASVIRQSADLTSYFAAGMLCWLRRDLAGTGRVPFLAGVLLLLVATQTPVFVPLAALAVGLLIPPIAYASADWPRRLTASGDYSYGIYLYAFPVQQTVVALLPVPPTWWLNILIAAPATLLLAVLSWHFVERPLLALKTSAVTTSSPPGFFSRIAGRATRSGPTGGPGKG